MAKGSRGGKRAATEGYLGSGTSGTTKGLRPMTSGDWAALEEEKKRKAAEEAKRAEEAENARIYDESEAALEKIAKQAISRLNRVHSWDRYAAEVDGVQITIGVERIPAGHPENERYKQQHGVKTAPYKYRAEVGGQYYYFSKPYQLKEAAFDMRGELEYAREEKARRGR